MKKKLGTIKTPLKLQKFSSLFVEGADKAPNRSMLRAVGFKDKDFKKPIIGIASTWSMVTPCNMHIDKLAVQAGAGADKAGGKSIIFNTITVSDGISMGTPGMRYSLVSREVIADSIETVAAGGGSICGFDGYKLTVGPESAGADPGPACYGAGGPLCITDVNLLAGRLDPKGFGIPVYPEQARMALEQRVRDIHSATGQSPDIDEILQKDDKIKASVTGCSTVTNVRVNALFGSAVSGDDKPPKP